MSNAIQDSSEYAGQIKSPGPARAYILGGNSRFTLKNLRSYWMTYRVKSGKIDRDKNWSTNNADKSIFFVSVLSGSDNDSDYQYIGFLKQQKDGSYKFISKRDESNMPGPSPSARLFNQFWESIEQGCRMPSWIEFWHEGQCCICGRALTVPESVERGIGPECAGKVVKVYE